MAEHAPDGLQWLAREIIKVIPTAEMSGIVGDPSHTYGYHRARNVLPGGDYSVQLPTDHRGDGDAASALDIKYSAKWMKIVTQRLMDSAKDQNDPRLNCVREFFGTVNGSTVAGWDTYYGTPATSDDSHLWHVHISVLRQYNNDKTKLADILSVIKGDDDMPSVKDMWTGYKIEKQDPKSGTQSAMTPASYLSYMHEYDKQQNKKLDTLIGLATAGTGADPTAIAAAMAVELKKSEARERAERATEQAALKASLSGMAPQIAAAVADALPGNVDVTALSTAIAAELANRLSE